MPSLLQDFRVAFRTMRKNPVLTTVALLSLAIGIGANTAIFTLTDQVLLRALPVRDPQQLVLFHSGGALAGYVNSSYSSEVSFSWPKYNAFRDRSRVFSGLIARFPFALSLASQGATERASGELVSGNYFDVLGIRPAAGRLLAPADDLTPSGQPVAVLAYGYWTRRFGGSSAILNQTLIVNGQPFTVIGVAQPGFRSAGAGEAPAVFIPITMAQTAMPGFAQLENPHGYWLNIIGRLKPGVEREQARAATEAVWRGILQEDEKLLPARASASFRAQYLKKSLDLKPAAGGISAIRESISAPLLVLTGMVGLVLLIACGNVANLLLARAVAREKEIAIRLALGAGRWRLVRQLLAESVSLALGGGALGLLISSWTGSLILQLLPHELPLEGVTADPDGRVLLFTFGVSVITGLLFGCVPALRATRPDLAPALNQQTATGSSGGHARFRKILVAGQMALSVLLLAAAGMFAHSLYNLRQLDPGFQADRVVTFAIDPSLNGYEAERTRALFSQVRSDLLASPGVSTVSMAREPLLAGSVDMSGYHIEGDEGGKDDPVRVIHQNSVGPAFFRTMGIPLVTGRDFEESDTAQAPRVAAINESLAKKYFEGRNPIGLHLTSTSSRGKGFVVEIIAVVKDSKYDDLRETPKPFAYLAAMQDERPGPITFYVRTSLEPGSLGAALREVVRRHDANLPVTAVKPMREQIGQSVFLDRMVAGLSCVFAVVATVLAAVGLYGVIAWAVARRRREIGIRMALGAEPAGVMRMVMAEVLWLGAAGIAVAAPLWIAAARVIKSQLYGVSGHDPLALIGAVALLSLTAAAAGLIPAFRASRVNPISAIRYE